MRRAIPALLALALLAVHAPPAYARQSANGPRVVYMAEATQRPIEIAISPRKVTLLRFEAGDVTMLVVGDRSLVVFEVHGQEVLLKAANATGRTNMFIWVTGQHTQWSVVAREGNDPRVVVVRPGERPRAAATPAPTARPSPAPQQTFARRPAPPREAATPAPTPAPAEDHRALLDRFLRGLTSEQARLFAEYSADPTHARLQALLRALQPEQRDLLMRLLTAGGVSVTTAQPPAPPVPPVTPAPPTPPPAQVTVTPGQQEIPGGVGWDTSVRRVGDVLLVNYAMSNEGQTTLLADFTRLRVYDAAGREIAFRVTRGTSGPFLGRLQPGEVETGVMTVAGSQAIVVIEWTLVEVGTGVTRLIRVRLAAP